jgi:hypothetical protein
MNQITLTGPAKPISTSTAMVDGGVVIKLIPMPLAVEHKSTRQRMMTMRKTTRKALDKRIMVSLDASVAKR